MIEFKMPALGADMDEGTLNEWLVKPGDTVSRGQVVAVVETTKAAVEVECWHDGVVHELLVGVGETVGVGTVLATLLEPGETVPAPRKRVARKAAAPAKPPAKSAPTGTKPAPPHRRWVSPAARRLAESLGIDVTTVSGTGPQGAVTIHDVEHAAASGKPQQPKAAAADRGAAMRRSIAAAMSRSKREIPHYYLSHEIQLEKALAWLTQRNAARPITERVLPAVLQLKAVGLAARQFGEFNGFWQGDTFQPATGVHVGVAINLRGGGLVAPAIHDVPDKKLDDLMSDLTDLVARARAGSLRSSEMSDPTITVTNLGDRGVDAVFGVIYPPQVALVGFGKPAQRVCVIDGGIRVVTTVQATLSADHRATDGHRGALFLAAIDELLQHPQELEK
ncbi:dihydrolipoamide acetyltransferase family protein [Mycobacterium branderi]|uniref:Dihydrolipoamide acetyltransferase component of pyruvate dehydrogenase complex n=1 Tax=Mycobacterium branderi TaxID=43348 RepID=A0A7I7W805_9MYCO|nr:dihydrolipoamide acetyltransferase family protein [Mycobacterium branderi]MCV7231294.1 2-oxo acid dehydrogenase subunit E2 [Mycobacterium branderi]ORA31664.1 branched-chain alpha-keto acid dehydrogenase subunit E2 [Mycobacterium branderi]BBZ12731.1 dihydrolipoamide acetyltransferase component of pyruvate dehydrogenase complex [Mycobacterium branderi]